MRTMFKTPAALACFWIAASFMTAGCKRQETPAPAEEPVAGAATGEANEAGSHVIKLTDAQVTSAGLKTGRVERRRETGLLETTAQIEPDGEHEARVGPRIEGRIAVMKAAPGDTVRQGQVLAVIESPEIGRTRADYSVAAASASVAAETAERERSLYDKRISSEREWRQAQAEAVKTRAELDAAEARLRALGVEPPEPGTRSLSSTFEVRTPIAGVVFERHATLGQTVGSSDTLFTIVDPRQVWILLEVYERDIPQIRIGQSAAVHVASLPGETMTGRVERIAPGIEAKARTLKVRVALPNPEGRLRPGMFANVSLSGTTGTPKDQLVVPTAALQRDGLDTLVFVPRGKNEFEARTVRIGGGSGDVTLVESGLAEGDTVVTTGSFVLKAELQKSSLGENE